MGSCGTHVYSCQISWSWWSQNSGNGKKKPYFGFFKRFLSIFLWKNSNKNWGRYPKFCLKKRLNLENLYAKFGKAHWSCLGIPAPNSPGCPKIQNFETFFCQLWKVFLAFWVIVPSWNFGIRFVHLLRTNTPSGHLDFTFFPRVSHFSKLGVNFRTQFLDFLAKKWKMYKIF